MKRTALTAVMIAAAAGFLRFETSADGISWPAGQFLPSFSPVVTLDIVSANVSNDDMILYATLQGLVNRTQPRIYLRQNFSEGADTWLQTLTGVTTTTISNPMTLITKYKAEISGIVVYDTTLTDTRNAAVTIAGIKNGIAVSPARVATLTAAPYSLPILEDLRNRFSTKLAVYKYLKAAYWSLATHRCILSINPAGSNNRDYAVALKAMAIWLDSRVSGEDTLYDSLLSDMPVNTPLLGWFPNPENGGEQVHVKYLAQHAKVAVGFDWFINATVFSGAPRAIAVPVPPAKPALQNKIYVTLMLSDGDNAQAVQHQMRISWNDTLRGKVPMGWTCSAPLVDIAPNILNWFQANCSANDVLISGPSGLGYTYPNNWPAGQPITTYATTSASYLDKAGMRIITVWDEPNYGFTSATASVYAANMPRLLGVTLQNTSAPSVIDKILPQMGMATAYASSESTIVNAVTARAAGWKGTAPLFLAAQGVLWTVTPTNLYNVMTTLQASNANYVFVRPDHFFQLYREANGLPIDPGQSGSARPFAVASSSHPVGNISINRDRAIVRLSGAASNWTARLIAVNGTCVMRVSGASETVSVPLGQIPPGVYFLHVEAGGVYFCGKIMKGKSR
jgi:hypothetical protein